MDSWWTPLVEGARLLAQAREQEAAKVVAMSPAPKAQHYAQARVDPTRFDGRFALVLRDTLFRAGDAVVQRSRPGSGYDVLDARTGLAYRCGIGLLRNAKRLAKAYANVDPYFARAAAGDVRAYMVIPRMSRISHQWNVR